MVLMASTTVSKTVSSGSNPDAPAISKKLLVTSWTKPGVGNFGLFGRPAPPLRRAVGEAGESPRACHDLL